MLAILIIIQCKIEGFFSDVYRIHNKIPFIKKYYILTITITKTYYNTVLLTIKPVIVVISNFGSLIVDINTHIS